MPDFVLESDKPAQAIELAPVVPEPLVRKQTKTGYCARCVAAGHFCDASPASMNDEEPLCIFCEDNEPCPRSRHTPTKLERPAFLADDKVARRDGVTYTVPRAHRGGRKPKAPKEQPLMEHRTCRICGAKVHALSKEPLCKEHNAQARLSSAASSCECGKPARHRGRCLGPAKRFTPTGSPKKVRKAKDFAPLPTKEQADALVAASEERTVASLLVTEAQLIAMFTAWPLEDKASCIQAYLDREVA